jgi:DNA-binding NarL/FixJ family response regulator
MPGGTPKTLTARHRAMAWLMASGLRRSEIAHRLGYAPTSVSHIAKSHAFRELVAQYQAAMAAHVIEAIAKRLVDCGRPKGLASKPEGYGR